MNRTDICWIDTMRPASRAQFEGWSCYLALHRDGWRKARIMFRKVHQGTDPGLALIELVAATGLEGEAMQRRLEVALRDLAPEAGGALEER